MPAAAPIIAAGATVAGVVSSHRAAQEQQQYQERQRQVQIRIDRLNARRERVGAYRERLRAEAETVQSGANVGVANGFGGTGYQGAIASLDTQYGANQAYVNKIDGLTNYGNSIVNNTGKYQSMSNLFGAVGSLAGDNFGGYSEVNSTIKGLFD